MADFIRTRWCGCLVAITLDDAGTWSCSVPVLAAKLNDLHPAANYPTRGAQLAAAAIRTGGAINFGGIDADAFDRARGELQRARDAVAGEAIRRAKLADERLDVEDLVAVGKEAVQANLDSIARAVGYGVEPAAETPDPAPAQALAQLGQAAEDAQPAAS